MSTLALIAQIGAATTLLVAAAAKAATHSRVAATLSAVGLRPAAPLAGALVAVELTAALALATHPHSPGARALLVALGTAFAAVGLVVRRRGTTITCACFGGAAGHPLGLRQVAAWPLWLAVALLAPASPLTGVEGLQALTVLAAAGAAAAAVPVLVTFVRSRRALAVAS